MIVLSKSIYLSVGHWKDKTIFVGLHPGHESALTISGSNVPVLQLYDHENIGCFIDILMEISSVERVESIDELGVHDLETNMRLDWFQQELLILLSIVKNLVLEEA